MAGRGRGRGAEAGRGRGREGRGRGAITLERSLPVLGAPSAAPTLTSHSPSGEGTLFCSKAAQPQTCFGDLPG